MFIARAETVERGTVIGIDFTPAMLDKARYIAEQRGFNNVEFRLGDIENIPVNDATVDVIVSNRVLNRVPNKDGVFKDMFRVLKPAGHFRISDVVLIGTLPHALQRVSEMYAGCVFGAIQKDEYLDLRKVNGFDKITVQKQKAINIPDDILSKYLNKEELSDLRKEHQEYLVSLSMLKNLQEKRSAAELIAVNDKRSKKHSI